MLFSKSISMHQNTREDNHLLPAQFQKFDKTSTGHPQGSILGALQNIFGIKDTREIQKIFADAAA